MAHYIYRICIMDYGHMYHESSRTSTEAIPSGRKAVHWIRAILSSDILCSICLKPDVIELVITSDNSNDTVCPYWAPTIQRSKQQSTAAKSGRRANKFGRLHRVAKTRGQSEFQELPRRAGSRKWRVTQCESTGSMIGSTPDGVYYYEVVSFIICEETCFLACDPAFHLNVLLVTSVQARPWTASAEIVLCRPLCGRIARRILSVRSGNQQLLRKCLPYLK